MTVLNDKHIAFRKMVRELAVKEIASKAALFDHGGESGGQRSGLE